MILILLIACCRLPICAGLGAECVVASLVFDLWLLCFDVVFEFGFVVFVICFARFVWDCLLLCLFD